MTLAEAEADKRFEKFKFMSMIDLAIYISKCTSFLADNPGDKEVTEFQEAAILINKSRSGIPV